MSILKLRQDVVFGDCLVVLMKPLALVLISSAVNTYQLEIISG